MGHFQVLGGPAWIDSDGYNIEAKAQGRASKDQVLLMMQSLFEDRFHLQTHQETKELPSYTLILAKGGAKLSSPKEGGCRDYGISPLSPQEARQVRPPPPCGHPVTLSYATGAIVQGGDLPMVELIKMLSELVGRPIVDKTGVVDNFDVHLEFYPDETTPGMHAPRRTGDPGGRAELAPGPSMMAALQEQLGLKLESTKGPVEVLVIDHVERPSGN
jgi:uncharacterized protein (TIGR03435 family)